MFPHRLKQFIGTDEVGLDERRGVIQRIVVVRFCGEMDDDVMGLDQLVDDGRVADRALDEGESLGGKAGQGSLVAGVGERIEDGD